MYKTIDYSYFGMGGKRAVPDVGFYAGSPLWSIKMIEEDWTVRSEKSCARILS